MDAGPAPCHPCRGTQQVLKTLSEICHEFREFYHNHDFTEIFPPTIIKTQCEGGSTLFKLQHINDPASLTQSSQLHLESVIAARSGVLHAVELPLGAEPDGPPCGVPALRRGSCSSPSTTPSTTPRASSAPSSTTPSKHGYKTHKMNPLFEAPARPFLWMTSADAIKHCNEHWTLKRGKPFALDEDNGEARTRWRIGSVSRSS